MRFRVPASEQLWTTYIIDGVEKYIDYFWD